MVGLPDSHGEGVSSLQVGLLTAEHAEAQRWARAGPAAVGSLVQAVAGPLLVPCHTELGSYAAPTGKVEGPQETPAGLRRRGPGCPEAGPRACLLFQCCTRITAHVDMCPHGELMVCVSIRPGCKKGWVPLRCSRGRGAVLGTSGLQSGETPSA